MDGTALDLDKRGSKEMDDKDVLGAVGTICEAVTILRTHFRLFTLIQLTLGLLLGVLLAASELAITLGKEWLISMGAFYTPMASPLPASAQAPPQPSDAPLILRVVFFVIPVVLSIGFAAVMIFIYQAAVSLCSSAILHAVRVHYSGRRVSYQAVLRAVVPSLWMRLTVTRTVCYLLWSTFVLVALAAAAVLLKKISVWLVLLLIVPILAGWLLRRMVMMPSGCVAVFEKDYGLAAVRRARSLLRGRLGAAFRFQLLWLVLRAIVVGACRYPFAYQDGDNEVLRLLFGAIYGYCLLQVWTLYDLCACVQYVSFRAYHNEDLTESMPYFGEHELAKRVFDDVEAHGEGESLVYRTRTNNNFVVVVKFSFLKWTL